MGREYTLECLVRDSHERCSLSPMAAGLRVAYFVEMKRIRERGVGSNPQARFVIKPLSLYLATGVPSLFASPRRRTLNFALKL